MALFSEPEFSVLGHVMDIELEIRSVFHAFDDHCVFLCPDDTDRSEITVYAETDFCVSFMELQMHIGRAKPYGSFYERREGPVGVLLIQGKLYLIEYVTEFRKIKSLPSLLFLEDLGEFFDIFGNLGHVYSLAHFSSHCKKIDTISPCRLARKTPFWKRSRKMPS